MKVVIIGAVAAGSKCAAKLKRDNPDFDVEIYTEEDKVSYSACGLPYYIEGIVKYENLIVRTPEEFEKNGIIMKIISGPDSGIYDAMNKGIDETTGDIVGILNSDDYFQREDIIHIISKTFNDCPEIEGLYGDAKVVSLDNTNKIVRYTRAKFFRPWMFKIGLMPPHPSFYAKKECFEKYGLYNPRFKIAADFDLMTRFMLIQNIKTKYLPIPI